MISLKPILPKKKLGDTAALERVVNDVMDNAAYDAMSLFLDTTKTWTHRPRFYIRKLKRSRKVGTDDKIFAFVDKGTRAHAIRPKRAGGVLRFKAGGFKAKTRAGVLSSNRGTPAKNWRSAKIVQHPGTEARGFSEKITERMGKELAKEMRKEMKRLFK